MMCCNIIFRSVVIPILTSGRELWVMSDRDKDNIMLRYSSVMQAHTQRFPQSPTNMARILGLECIYATTYILSALSNSQSAQATLDAINSAFHKAATTAGCFPEKKFEPKPFWCPGTKQFWFQLWFSCGRPKSETLYDCHKLVKKTFRRSLRQNVNGHLNQFNVKLNYVHQSRKLTDFWNTIKGSRSKLNFSSHSVCDTVQSYSVR